MTTAAKLQVCSMCKETRKLVRPVATANGTVLVGKCTICDARQCQSCAGYTADPGRVACKHCGNRFD